MSSTTTITQASTTSLPTKTSQWILANPPTGNVVLSGSDATFQLREAALPELKEGQVLLQNLYFSNDPAQRTWIWPDFPAERHYVEPVRKGSVMRDLYVIAKVLSSTAESLKEGQLVICTGVGWSKEAVLDAAACRPLQQLPGLGLEHFLGAFAGTGITALYGLTDVGEVTAEDTICVSGAAGATGSMVVQLAKHVIGCKRVIGIAGGEKKCKWVESLGADVCVDYKAADFKEQLYKATTPYPTVYFDNVAGQILDLMLTRLERNGRIIACGGISNYNTSGNTDDANHTGLKNWMQIVTNRLQVRGFIVTDLGPKLYEYGGKLVGLYMQGKLKLTDDNNTVVDTKWEDFPKTWNRLFSGGNQGKLITHVV